MYSKNTEKTKQTKNSKIEKLKINTNETTENHDCWCSKTRSKHSKGSKERYLLGQDWQNQQSLVVFRLAAVKCRFSCQL